MELQTVLSTLRQLADGIDPATGEVFPPDSPYQQPQTVRALFTAIKYLEEVHKVIDRGSKRPPRTGEQWTKTESAQLLQAFNSGTSIMDLAQKHQRTTGAIRSQLQRLGIIFEK